MPQKSSRKRTDIYAVIPVIIMIGGLYMALAMYFTADAVPAKIVKVIDGKTLVVDTPDCQDCTLRVEGIEAPEADQPYGQQAREMLEQFVGGVGATVDVAITSAYEAGQFVGEVYRDEINIGWAMIRNGGAYILDASSPALQRLQAAARRTGSGLWGLIETGEDGRNNADVRQVMDGVQDAADALDDAIKNSAKAIGELWRSHSD